MKSLKKISLRQLDKAELSKRQEGLLFGGGDPGACKCGSCSTTEAHPTTIENLNANTENGYYITGDNEPQCVCLSGNIYYNAGL